MTKILLYITNIPTPYRNFRFNALAKVCEQNGYHLRVLYMNASEPDRAWTINTDDIQHDYQIFSHNKVKQALGMWLHVCPKLHTYLLRSEYDVAVLGGLASPAHFIASLLLKSNKLNFLSVESNLSSIGNHSGLATKVKTFLMRRFNYFQVTGSKAADFIKHYVPDAKSEHMVTLPNVINEPLFDASSAEELPSDFASHINDARAKQQKVIFIPARLIEEKGLYPFLEVVKPSDAILIFIAGDGPLKAQLNSLIAENKINVVLLGAQSPEVTASLMKAADFLCLPSKSDPSPLSVIEACACGLPILASRNIGNFEDAVIESNDTAKQNGWGFDFADPVSTRNGLEKVLHASEPEMRAMSKAGKAQFEARFRAERVLQSYIDALSKWGQK